MSDTISKFANEMVIEQSSRSHVLLLVGFFGYSGGGKTVTALIAATGLVGPDSKIGIVDSEQHRSGFAVDVVKDLAVKRYGKSPEFSVIYIDAPFHPLKYVAAMLKLQEAGCKAILVDSMTSCWSGEGGYLDLKEQALEQMAGNDWKKREKCAMAAAARVKPHTHGKLIDTILHLKVPLILCFRGKEKTVMGKDEQNKTTITQNPYGSPIQEETLIFEMLLSSEVKANEDGVGGYCRWTGPGCKFTHPALLALLPKPNEQFSFSHAEQISKWCQNPGSAPATTQATKTAGGKPGSSILREIRDATVSIHHWDGTRESWEFAKGLLEVWLVENTIIAESEQLATLSVERLSQVLDETRAALNPKTKELL